MNTVFYIVLAFCMTSSTVHAEYSDRWTIKYKSELLSRVVSIGHHYYGFGYVPPSEVRSGVLVFYLGRSAEYLSVPQEERLEPAKIYLDLVVQYVLADSIKYFSTVIFDFVSDNGDTSYLRVHYNLAKLRRRKVKALTPSERLELLSESLPLEHVKFENPSFPYIKRMMGFSFPCDRDSVQFNPDILVDYAKWLAAIMYDFVLKRQNDVVPKIYIGYFSHAEYLNLRAQPKIVSIYSVYSPFFEDIRNNNATIDLKLGH